jgi:acyl-coenzyme A synthetase/AMP-(fatty) acid ligase
MLTGPTIAYPSQTALELVKVQAKKTPEAPAVALHGRTLHYKDLDMSSLGALVAGISPDLASKHEFENLPKGMDAVCLVQSSGTTGTPKRVVKTNRNIVSRLAWEAPAADDVLLVYPHGLPRLLVPLMLGKTAAVIDDKGAINQVFAQMQALGVTHVTLFPSILDKLVYMNPAIVLPRLREMVAIGGLLPNVVRERFTARYPHAMLIDSYGSTEAGYCLRDWKPVPNVSAWVAGEDLNEVRRGVWGRLVIEGASVAAGYADPIAGGFENEGHMMRFRSSDWAREMNGRIELMPRNRGTW